MNIWRLELLCFPKNILHHEGRICTDFLVIFEQITSEKFLPDIFGV
jgi:hypothetical protein